MIVRDHKLGAGQAGLAQPEQQVASEDHPGSRTR
jgi:hypothetical protein